MDFIDKDSPARIRMYGTRNCTLPTTQIWVILGNATGRTLLADVKPILRYCPHYGCQWIGVSIHVDLPVNMSEKKILRNIYVKG